MEEQSVEKITRSDNPFEGLFDHFFCMPLRNKPPNLSQEDCVEERKNLAFCDGEGL